MSGCFRKGLLKLIASLVLMAGASAVQAGEFCSASPYNGVVDGTAGYPIDTQITIDTDCVFQNFTPSNPLTATLNFQTNDPSIYLITFNNVYYTGNMACASIDHKIWAVNGSVLVNLENKASCQDLFIPVETINKASPTKTSVGVGEEFTYTLTLPYMQAPLGDPSPNELRNVILWDDLARIKTGADLTYVGINAYYLGTGNPVTLTPELDGTITLPDVNGNPVVQPSLCGTWTPTNLCYEPIPVINIGEQIIVEITVRVDDTAGNIPGTVFTNTANWWFGRDIDVDGDGTISPEEKFVPLPGEWGVSEPMTITTPVLVVNKTSPETALNLGDQAAFTIDVQNTGGTDAWHATIVDKLPEVSVPNPPDPDLTAGMCATDPTASVGAGIYASDGTTLLRSLVAGVGNDYTISYTGSPTCELVFTMLNSNSAIGAGEHLIITYVSQLDPGTDADGVDLVNIAAATEWFSADTSPDRLTYTGPLTDGTEGVSDNQDSYTVTTGLSGYYFQKTVVNITSGDNPATLAAPGDQLRYRLRVFNVDQNINSITITDNLDPALFNTATFSMQPLPASATFSFNAGTGDLTIFGSGGQPLDVNPGQELVIEFDINLASSGFTNGDLVPNGAILNATGLTIYSDDPYVNGIASPAESSDPNLVDKTTVEIQYPGPLLKANSQTTARIGEQFTYTITIPETPVDVPLYDVRILDDLSASSADIAFVSASVVSGGTWSLTNTGTSTNIVLEDVASGIDIPALGQAVIEITVELQNTTSNNAGQIFNNTATFTYNRTNANAGTQTAGGSSTTADMTVVEPQLTVTKTGTEITAAPLSGGSIIEYVISMTNNGSSTAYNVNVVDTLPPELLQDTTFTPTATIGGVDVVGFDPLATNSPAGPLIWGSGNGDVSLDIPVGETLLLTYRAQVQISTAATFNNTASVDWRSLDIGNAEERSGDGCPVITAPDDYCVTVVGNSFSITDNNSLSKSITADSWITDGSTPGDSTVRIGDTVTYQVTISLGEGNTDNVRVEDVLPTGMEFDSLVSITPASGASSFIYTLSSQPALGDSGTLIWNFGNVTNTPSNDGTPNDTLVIEYNARVLADSGIPHVDLTTLTNTATLKYDDSFGTPVVDPARLEDSAQLTLKQPVMGAITKTGNGVANTVATPLNVDVTTDTVQFQLEACNAAFPAGPAYSVKLTDVLPTQIDETTLTNPVVTINGVVGVINTDYTYIAPAGRGGSLEFELLTPVFDGECVTIDYTAGFYTDFGANQTWSNTATLDEYWSQAPSSVQIYPGSGPVHFYMTNVVGAAPISKVVATPASGEITIGEQAIYTITVPTSPINASLDNVVVTDALHPALSYVGATAVDGNSLPVTLTDNTTGQNVDLRIAQIPAGEQVIITLTTLVDNNASANAGTIFTNTVGYTHSANATPVEATSAALTIVEPAITIGKTVSPTTAPNFNDILTYSVTFTAGSGANLSDAFDLQIDDDLSLGLVYVNNSSAIDGAGNTVGNPVITGDGINTPQHLVWSLGDANADIDVVEGSTVTLTYQVQVLDAANGVVPGQNLTNSATVQWTGLDGINGDERTGTATPVENDYFTGPVTTSLIVQPGALTKTTGTTTVTVGDQFTYTITVPGTAQPTDLNDVRILDDLTASAADLGFVSATVVSGGSWTLTNTGTTTNVILEDTTNGIDIPANTQAVIEITVEVLDTATNVDGLIFNNTADYTYNATQEPGLPGTSTDTTIQESNLVMNKTGPATMRVGLDDTFTLDLENTGLSTAWDVTITDQIPNASPGGMCDTSPTNIVAGIYDSTGTTLVTGLSQPADYTVSFAGSPTCRLILTMTSAAAAIAPGQHLIVTYDHRLDTDTVSGTSLTNVAAATEWFSADTNGTGATGSTRTYTGTLSTGTVGTDDEQDAHTLITESPVVYFSKSVLNVTPGTTQTLTASPGDTVEYTLTLNNVSPVDVPDFSILDDLGALSPQGVFVPGSLVLAPIAGADTSNTDPNGGTNGIGLLDIRNLVLPAGGTVTITYQLTLQPVITNDTVSLNQATMTSLGVLVAISDDPNVNGQDDPNVAGGEDPTVLQVRSAPVFETLKSSQDLTGDPNVLLPGDTLRYTITVQNIGTDHATDTTLSDQIPANTTYVAGTTRLNGVLVTDPSAGVSALQAGMLINAPGNTTPGVMRTSEPNNIATITFDVVVNSGVSSGIVITNQGFVAANDDSGSAVPLTPSDDPSTTTIPDDPTVDVVGALPLLDAQKTVQVIADNGVVGIIDTGDVLLYTFNITNSGPVAATNVVLTDAGPTNADYSQDTTQMNSQPVGQPDGDVLPLIAGIAVNSPDQAAGSGIVSAGGTATITFEATVTSSVSGDEILNQGEVTSNEQPLELTDEDGIDSNGDQPTRLIIGTAQQLTITKQAFVVGGGPVLPGSELEYVITVTNIASVPATNVVITDNLDSPVANQMTYINGSGLLNGLPAGVTGTSSTVLADYAGTYGDLPAGQVAELRFHVLLDNTLQQGVTVSNTAVVQWFSPGTSDSATVDVIVGALPGATSLNGNVWHDTSYDGNLDAGEPPLQGWRVDLYRSGSLINSITTGANGQFQFSVFANDVATPGDVYDLRFTAPGAGLNTASMGSANSGGAYTDGQQSITNIVVGADQNVFNLNMPVKPNGVVYDSVTRTAVAGATVRMVYPKLTSTDPTVLVANTCFEDTTQQGQVTLASGFYKFELTDACANDEYVIEVIAPNATAPGISGIIPPTTDVFSPGYDVTTCPADAAPTPACEVQVSPAQPPSGVLPADPLTGYYLRMVFSSTTADDKEIYNNHVPVDLRQVGAVAVTKTSSLVNVNRSQLVPYVISMTNTLAVPLYDVGIVDQFPAGFKYVANSAQVQVNNGAWVKTEPVIDSAARTLSWPNFGTLAATDTVKIKLLLVVGSGVGEGEYINRARGINVVANLPLAADAQATVRVVPDPTFDCTDIIGKVFDDKNLNGYQDDGEEGLPDVRVVTVNGMKITTDKYGRFHLACAAVPDANRGSNFILKLDERSLPTGYRITTENPRVVRVTRGKMAKINFGATIHRIVRLDMADPVFEPGTTEMRPQWLSRIDLLMSELVKDPSVLRISYLAENEAESLVDDRVNAIKEEIEKRWEAQNCCYRLTIETEVFWRKGGPVDKDEFD